MLIIRGCSQTLRKQPADIGVVSSKLELDKLGLMHDNTVFKVCNDKARLFMLLFMNSFKILLFAFWLWTAIELDWPMNRGDALSICMTHDVTRMFLLMGWMLVTIPWQQLADGVVVCNRWGGPSHFIV